MGETKRRLASTPHCPGRFALEGAYSQGEVYTFSEIAAGDGLVQITCLTEQWIKSRAPGRSSTRWGVESMATIEGPDGASDVRDHDGKVIASVKAGERFIAVQLWEGAAQWESYLASGVSGFMHQSRIRLQREEPVMKLNYEPSKMKWKKALSNPGALIGEATRQARARATAYYPTLLLASEGDLEALARFFSGNIEEKIFEEYVADAWQLFHIVGDEMFAKFLDAES